MAITDEVTGRWLKGDVLTIKWKKSGEIKYIKSPNNGWFSYDTSNKLNDITQEFLNNQLELLHRD